MVASYLFGPLQGHSRGNRQCASGGHRKQFYVVPPPHVTPLSACGCVGVMACNLPTRTHTPEVPSERYSNEAQQAMDEEKEVQCPLGAPQEGCA